MPKVAPLIKMDINKFGEFYQNLVNAYGRYVVCGLSLQNWANENGDGFLTYGMANASKALIKNMISGKVNLGQNWAPPSKEHVDSFPEIGANGRTWDFQGRVKNSIVARKQGRGYEVGINRNAYTKKVGFSTIADTRKKRIPKIRVETYAAFVEYGTSWMVPRPLFALVHRHVAQVMGPGMVRLVRASMKRVARIKTQQYVGSKFSSGSISSTVGESTLRAAAPERDFADIVSREQEVQAHLTGTKTSFVGEAGLNKEIQLERSKSMKTTAQFLASQTAEDQQTAMDWLTKMGIDPDSDTI